MGKFIKESWLIAVTALVFGLLVAGVNGALKERIDANKVVKRDNFMKKLLGESCVFEELKVKDDSGVDHSYFQASENGKITGYCFMTVGNGYAGAIEMLIAVDGEFDRIKGFAEMKSQETPGFGDKIKPTGPGTFSNEFVGSPCPKEGSKLQVVKVGDKSNRDDREIVAITGATITSDAVTKAINKEIIKMKGLIKK